MTHKTFRVWCPELGDALPSAYLEAVNSKAAAERWAIESKVIAETRLVQVKVTDQATNETTDWVVRGKRVLVIESFQVGAHDLRVPSLGGSVERASVTSVRAVVGQAVKQDETLFEVETDKADTEIHSPMAGVITQVVVKVGDVVKPGSLLCYIERKL